MIASLMMYARPELDRAHHRYWVLIREALADHGIDSPDSLSQDAGEFEVWRDPNLVLSQTCGMPYRLWLHNQVSVVGTPDFDLDGCPPGYYASALVVRADDPRLDIGAFADGRFAYNQTYSQSGWAAAYNHLNADRIWFKDLLHTSAHSASALAVTEGHADIAALDGQTWRLLQRYESWATKLRVLFWTEPTPGLPYISSPNLDADAVFNAVADAIRALTPEDRDQLGIQRLVKIPKADYLSVPNPPASAAG